MNNLCQTKQDVTGHAFHLYTFRCYRKWYVKDKYISINYINHSHDLFFKKIVRMINAIILIFLK